MDHDRSIVIIGCGAGGGTAAQFARKTDRKAEVTIFEKGQFPQYSKCGLPYAISGRIPIFENIIEFSEEWFKKTNITLNLKTEVKKIDVKNQRIIAKKNDETIEKSYDSLIIGTGAKPLIPQIKDIELNGKLADGCYVIRTFDDAKNISSKLHGIENAVVIGAGLIGLEMADNLHEKGINVTVLEMLPQILAHTIDTDMANIVQGEISKHVNVLTDYIATKIEGNNGKPSAVLVKNNTTGEEKTIVTNMVILAVGTRPEVNLAKEAGCTIGTTGGIVVNEKCETSLKNIYAVGDCTEYQEIITKKPVLIGLGSIAVRQGIAAGINAAGRSYSLPTGVLQTRTSKFFNLEIAAVGPSTDSLTDFSVISGKISGFSLPEYFPNGKPIWLKIVADAKTGKILSAQAVGDNAAQRINTFACGILSNMNIEMFRKLETAYAPPVAPPLDVLTLVCDIVYLKMKRRQ